MNMEMIQQQLGPLTVPMLVLSLLVLIVLIENSLRLLYASMRWLPVAEVTSNLESSSPNGQVMNRKDHERVKRLPLVAAQGVHLLSQHCSQPKEIREEISAIWLLQRKRKLSSGLRVLQAIAVLAPLLGLLGTVLGLIRVFDDLSIVSGPIEPSMLAAGLSLAMYTTAAGLLIAMPAIIGVQGFSIWVDRLLNSAEHVMNHFNLMMEGVRFEDDPQSVNGVLSAQAEQTTAKQAAIAKQAIIESETVQHDIQPRHQADPLNNPNGQNTLREATA
ncbi:MotA/TolQ/ExbB proton channel family protein [Aestuariirhabdus sp. Z084]|uniref:MotA/TolQ/ExbB proton channel family protein n=1 Tax=Aestuariirhabdus haliotis TaxID=2918751 RepID=UPI00201B4442|nr:MotA/TolQ/ExbB proton channel family protein [Aestuariirhabdus haliotis]MCL6417472.1 MotA/TolQ/ExbB proton channel family protein [Aestuariirhabdus haliotis]MCL6421409.1 MotA/TolQ/ExbB proton channel family protein [Aestuariirhabdus haliotis]